MRNNTLEKIMQTVLTADEKETELVGRKLGEKLRGGEVIALDGDLGAGKTIFTKGIAKGLGISAQILSPTFNIVREYAGRLKLYHFDFYRLSEAEELREIGFAEYLQPDAVVVIEWAELFPEVLPQQRISVHISYQKENETGRELLLCGEETFLENNL